jgi:hypothetical protein
VRGLLLYWRQSCERRVLAMEFGRLLLMQRRLLL